MGEGKGPYLALATAVLVIVTVGVWDSDTAGQVMLALGFGTLTLISLMNLHANATMTERVARIVADVMLQVNARNRQAEDEANTKTDVLLLESSEIKALGTTTHRLVAAAQGTQLRLLMLAYRRLAEQGSDPVDISLYEQAKAAYEAHIAGEESR